MVFNGAKLESEHCFPRFYPILWVLGRENGLAGSISDLTDLMKIFFGGKNKE